MGRAAGEGDRLGDLDRLLLHPGDGDGRAGLADGGGQGGADPVLGADADLHLGQDGLDGRGGAAGLPSSLPSTLTETGLGVVTATARPCRPRVCERETDSLAVSARMPISDSAEDTVVAVVQ